MKTLEDILKDYDFIPKSKRVFLKKPKEDKNGLVHFFTKDGEKAFVKLLALLSDLEDLTGVSVKKIIEEMDYIEQENY